MAVSFKEAHFPQETVLTCVRWYVAYPLSTRYGKNSCGNVRSPLGDRYIERTRDDIGNALFRMRPERWLTVDYAKPYQSP